MSKISSFSIILIFISLSLASLFFLPKLSVKLNPTTALPSMSVNFSYPGASPEAVNDLVISRLEPAISGLKGIRKIKSYAYNGYGYIDINLKRNIDRDFFRFELASIIRSIYPQLPKQTSFPQISNNTADDKAKTLLMSFSLAGSASISEISDYAQKVISPVLASVEGVSNVAISGRRSKVFVIRYKPEVLKKYDIKLEQIQQRISDNYRVTELGRTFDKSKPEIEIYCRLKARKDTVNDLWNTVVATIQGKNIYLGEIASISQKEIKPIQYFRINGKNTVNLNISVYKYANSLVVAKQIKQKIKNFTKTLPPSYQIILQYDSSKKIEKELNKIFHRTAFTIILLLLFVFLVRLEWQYLLIIFLSLFTNIALAFPLYYLFGVEIQLYSLAGITISLGFAIDNSLVIFEHIRSSGNKKVFIAILASTLTTIGALAGIYFLDEKIKLQLVDFATVIIINLFVSLVVAYFYVPALIEKMYKNGKQKKFPKWYFSLIHFLNKIYAKLISLQLKKPWITILFFVLLFGLPVFKLPTYLPGNTWTAKLYNNTIGSEFYDNYIREYANKLLGGTLRLFTYYVFDNDFYSEKRETKLYVLARAPYGTTVEQLNEVFKQLESHLIPYKEIDKFLTTIQSAQNAQIEISFKPEYANGMFPYILKSRIAALAFDLGAIDWTIYGVGKAVYTGTYSGGMPSYVISLKGYNYNQIRKQADRLSKIILQHPRVQEVFITSPLSYKPKNKTYNLLFNQEKLLYKNSNVVSQSADLTEYSASKAYDFTVYRKNKVQKMKFIPDDANSLDFWYLNNKNFGTDTLFARLKEMTKIRLTREMSEIYRVNQEFELYLRYNYVGSQKFGDKYLKKVLKKARKILPLGYHVEKKRDDFWYFSWEKPAKPYYLVLLVIIINFIGTILFESLKQPFAVLILIPVSFIGVFLTFYWFDLNFDMGGFASFFLLSGLTVNSGIYLINDYNAYRRNKPEKYKLLYYLRAFRHKFQPILLTILSTAFGMIPFLWGGQNETFWFSLAAGTIGGLFFSIIGIIFMLPVLIVGREKNA